MSTFLLSWNPKKWAWKDEEFTAKVLEVQAAGGAEDKWSCGNRYSLATGSRCFLIRLGKPPRGIVGSAITLSAPSVGPHWDPTQRKLGKSCPSIRIRFDFLSREPVVTWDELHQAPFSSMHWAIQGSGVVIPEEVATPLEQLWMRRTNGDALLPDEVQQDPHFWEGARKQIYVNAYERNPQARAACIAHFGYRCSVCDLMLEEIYGPIASHFIHVHHLVAISEVSAQYIVDPKKDLRPVCPNCHAIIHRKVPAMSLEHARKLVKRDQECR